MRRRNHSAVKPSRVQRVRQKKADDARFHGMKKENTNPKATVPPSVNSSGRISSSKSVAISPIRRAEKTAYLHRHQRYAEHRYAQPES